MSREKRLAFAERSIGSSLSVLFERGETEGMRLGTTANFLKVGIASNMDLAHQVHQVRITGASDRWAVGQLATADMGGLLS
jgi:hypothetical protein